MRRIAFVVTVPSSILLRRCSLALAIPFPSAALLTSVQILQLVLGLLACSNVEELSRVGEAFLFGGFGFVFVRAGWGLCTLL